MPVFSQSCHQQLQALVNSGPDAHLLQAPPVIVGSLFAVAAAPDIPLPNIWLPWMFKSHVDLDAIQDLNGIHDVLMSCLQWQLQIMRNNQVDLLSDLAFSVDKNSVLAQWMQGLIFGHNQLDSTWRVAWQAMLKQPNSDVIKLQKDLSHCLSVLSTFADIPFALQQAEQKGNTQLKAMLPKIYQSLPDILRLYVNVSGQLVAYLPNQFETFVNLNTE